MTGQFADSGLARVCIRGKGQVWLMFLVILPWLLLWLLVNTLARGVLGGACAWLRIQMFQHFGCCDGVGAFVVAEWGKIVKCDSRKYGFPEIVFGYPNPLKILLQKICLVIIIAHVSFAWC